MSEQKDTYLEQLKQSADWAGTYLSGVSGRLTVEQVEKIHGIIEKYSTDVVDYELATDDINAALWPNAPALTSGDGSESANWKLRFEELAILALRSESAGLRERLAGLRMLSHADVCQLSRSFNVHGLISSQFTRINEALKEEIAIAWRRENGEKPATQR